MACESLEEIAARVEEAMVAGAAGGQADVGIARVRVADCRRLLTELERAGRLAQPTR